MLSSDFAAAARPPVSCDDDMLCRMFDLSPSPSDAGEPLAADPGAVDADLLSFVRAIMEASTEKEEMPISTDC